jgi:hypothetical protein
MFSLGVIWQAGSYLAADDVPPGPVASVLAVGQSSREGYLWSDIAITTYRVSGAFLIAFVAAVATGALLGRSQLAERLFRPWVTIGASIPPLIVIVIVYLTVGVLAAARLREELVALCTQKARTALFVTHSIYEACHLADRVVVLGPHPSTVVADVAIKLPRPRGPDDPRLAAYAASSIRSSNRAPNQRRWDSNDASGHSLHRCRVRTA